MKLFKKRVKSTPLKASEKQICKHAEKSLGEKTFLNGKKFQLKIV
jgi:hypothetical protein